MIPPSHAFGVILIARLLILAFSLVPIGGPALYAEEEGVMPTDPTTPEPVAEPSPTPTDDGYVDPVEYSQAEKKETCRKYSGKYLGYYDNVYFVEKCAFREIQSADVILDINKRKIRIVPIDGEVLAKLEKGPPITGDQKKLCVPASNSRSAT